MAAPYQDHQPVAPGAYKWQVIVQSQVTVTGTVGLGAGVNAASPAATVAVPDNANSALITVETANVRWCADGQTPTASFGQLLVAGQTFDYSGDLNAIKFAAVSGTPVLDVVFKR